MTSADLCSSPTLLESSSAAQHMAPRQSTTTTIDCHFIAFASSYIFYLSSRPFDSINTAAVFLRSTYPAMLARAQDEDLAFAMTISEDLALFWITNVDELHSKKMCER
jgi:hypothetical protein